MTDKSTKVLKCIDFQKNSYFNKLKKNSNLPIKLFVKLVHTLAIFEINQRIVLVHFNLNNLKNNIKMSLE